MRRNWEYPVYSTVQSRKREKKRAFEQQHALSENLKSLKGAQIQNIESKALEQKGMEVFCMKVTAPEKWTSHDMKILVQTFGEATMQAFGPRESSKKFNFDFIDKKKPKAWTAQQKKLIKSAKENLDRESDFGCSDTVYVVAQNGKLVSFFSASHKDFQLQDEAIIKGLMINLVYTAPDKRNHHLHRELFDIALSREKYDALLSCTSTPGAVKEHLLIAKKNGYANFYGGYLEGLAGEYGTDEQQDKVRQLTKKVQEYYFEAEATPPMEDMRQNNPNDLVILAENEPIPPLKKKDVDFQKLGKSLAGVYTELLERQKRTKDTLYPVLISLPNKK